LNAKGFFLGSSTTFFNRSVKNTSDSTNNNENKTLPGTAHRRSLLLLHRYRESKHTGYQAHQDPKQGRKPGEHPAKK